MPPVTVPQKKLQKKLDKFLTLSPASPLHNILANDVRNWDDLNGWAEKLSSALLSAKNPSVL
jgi:hypothetical protein